MIHTLRRDRLSTRTAGDQDIEGQLSGDIAEDSYAHAMSAIGHRSEARSRPVAAIRIEKSGLSGDSGAHIDRVENGS
jgi:hypothetical protein